MNDFKCIECNASVSKGIASFAKEVYYGHILCRTHQARLRKFLQSEKTTRTAIQIYLMLKENKINAVLEKWDGHKAPDITIEESKLHIEIDGQHHHFNPKQATTDLKRTYHSLRNGYYTIRIPNILNQYHETEWFEYLLKTIQLKRPLQ